jgi:hypothetical protein
MIKADSFADLLAAGKSSQTIRMLNSGIICVLIFAILREISLGKTADNHFIFYPNIEL